VTAILRDGGGTDFGGVDTSDPQQFTIRVMPANDAPVAVARLFSHSVLRKSDRMLVALSIDGVDPLVVLDGRTSYDIDGDPLNFSWLDAGQVISTSALSTNRMSLGSHAIELRVYDGVAASKQMWSVEVIGPDTAIKQFIATIRLIGGLSGHQRQSLVTPLE